MVLRAVRVNPSLGDLVVSGVASPTRVIELVEITPWQAPRSEVAASPPTRPTARARVRLLLEVDLLQVSAHAEPQEHDSGRQGQEDAEAQPSGLHVLRVRDLLREGQQDRPDGVHAHSVSTRSRTPAKRSSSGGSTSTRLRASS